MADTQKKNKGGRPRIQIDAAQFENLCKLQCTQTEIAGWFNCSPDTIERWCIRNYKMPYNEAYAIYSEAGKISLRRAQWQMAQKNASMAIFLGKNYLGQSDDPKKYAKEETAEDKLDKLLDSLEDALQIPDGDES